MAWLALVTAGLMEVFGVWNMKRVLDRKWDAIIFMFVGFGISFSLLSFAMQTIPMGTAYGGGSGIDVAPAPRPTKPVIKKPFLASADAAATKGANIKTDGPLDYGIGDRVKHIKFGEGTVQNIVDGGRDFEVTVEFDRAGVKKMFAAFAKLVKV